MSLLIKNGTLVTATDTFESDIFVNGEKIECIGKNLNLKADRTIDAKGMYVMPGGIDAHTHLDLPFMGTSSSDDFETGTVAALHGGTTTIIDFAIQSHGDTLNNALNQWMEKANGKATCDYAFHVAVTDFNDKTKAEIKDLVEVRGVTSFKTFMAYKGALMVDDRQMFELMKETSKYGAFVTTHAENGDIIDSLVKKAIAEGNTEPKFHALTRPPLAEAEATGRFLDMAFQGGFPCYVVHMTCEEAVQRVRESLKRNQKPWIETCVQYLLLDDSVYEKNFDGAKYVMSPPIRKKKDQEALWSGLQQGIVQVVATDHCPFCMDQKKMGEGNFSKIPNGAPGIEHRMELMFSEGVLKNKISLNKFVEVNSTNPAKIFGLYPRKGSLTVGGDADLIILDPKQKHTLSAKTHHMNCDYSAYEGWQITGKIRETVLRGAVVVENGKANVKKGSGQYLKRSRSHV